MAGTYLIVNADDFGQSHGVNRGVIAAHVNGIVTAASLMVRWPAAAEAVELARAHPALDLGLHLDLGEWTVRNGTWVPVYEVVPLTDPAAVAEEVERQLVQFRRLVSHDPTHLDSHQHVHRSEPVLASARAAAARLGIPLRHDTADVNYCGAFYGQARDGWPYPDGIGVAGLIATLAALDPGVTELACHPGLGDDADSMYRTERTVEVATLCHPDVRTILLRCGIHLCSFLTRPKGQ